MTRWGCGGGRLNFLTHFLSDVRYWKHLKHSDMVNSYYSPVISKRKFLAVPANSASLACSPMLFDSARSMKQTLCLVIELVHQPFEVLNRSKRLWTCKSAKVLTMWSLIMRSFSALTHLDVLKAICSALTHCALVACGTRTVILLVALSSIGRAPLGSRTNSRFWYSTSIIKLVVVVILSSILVAISAIVRRWHTSLTWQRRRFGWPNRFTWVLNDFLPSILTLLG